MICSSPLESILDRNDFETRNPPSAKIPSVPSSKTTTARVAERWDLDSGVERYLFACVGAAMVVSSVQHIDFGFVNLFF
jgi:hypothetical protein